MENQPLISVIVPCYNQAQYLDECLQSVLDQTFQNWECIIVNDGSPDNTEEIALQWVKRDVRFIYLKKVNGGVSSARNLGIDNANGKYIVFIDSDDTVDEKYLSSFTNHITTNIEFIVQDFNRVNSKTKSHNFLGYEDVVFNLTQKSHLNHLKYLEGYVCNKLYKKEILNIYNIRFDTSLTLCEDLKFYLEYLQYIEIIKFVKDSNYNYYYRDESATNANHQSNNFIEIFRIYNKIFDNYKLISIKEIRQKYTYLFLKFLSSMDKKSMNNKIFFLKSVYSTINFKLIYSKKHRHRLFKYLYFFKLYRILIYSFKKLTSNNTQPTNS